MKKLYIMLLAMLSCVVSAYAFEVDGISYNITTWPNGESPGKVEVTAKSNGYTGNIVIPTEVAQSDITYEVTSIGNGAFLNCSDLSSITIPNSVTKIGNKAFQGCSNLTSAILGDQLETIGEYAFQNCTSLSSITIPNSVKRIASDAFQKCSNLATVILGDQLTTIGQYTFSYCTSLSSITIPNSVTTIDGRAFYECSSLTSVILGNQLTTIGYEAFRNCTSLSSITIPNSVVTMGRTVFADCKGLTSVILGNQLTTIVDETFYNCTGLSSITLPSSVTTIGKDAFYKCTKLKDVKIVVMDYSEFCNNLIVGSFNGTTQLLDNEGNEITEYTIPDGVTTVGESAFRGCCDLTSITIPSSVTSIGTSAFSGCSGLIMITSKISTPFAVNAFSGSFNTTLVVPMGSRADYKSIGGWNFAFIYEEGETIYDREQTDEQGVKYTLKQAADDSFYYSVTGHSDELNPEIDIPENIGGCPVRTFEERGFEGGVFCDCTTLKKITIPNSITSIGSGAFAGCSNLTSVILSNQLTAIGYEAFRLCTSLSSITIPNSVTSIGWSAFSACRNLTSVIISDQLETIEGYAFSECTALSSIKIPNNVTTIGFRAFYECRGLSSITIPSSITNIGENVFFNCRSLNDVKVVVMDCSDFCNNHIVELFNCPIQLINTDENEITEYIISEDVTSIGDNTFRNCRYLSSITIPSSVTSIGNYAFYGCSGLRLVTSEISSPFDVDAFNNFNATLVVPKGSRANYKSVGGWGFAFIFEEGETMFDKEQTDEQGLFYTLKQAEDDYSFYYSVTGHSDELNADVVIPADLDGCSVRIIEENVFNGCTNLSSITVPNSVTSIGYRAFHECSNLTTVILGRQLKTIEAYAFYGCSSLASITIPHSVTTIGIKAFDCCVSLTSVKIGNSVSSIGREAFSHCNKLSSIKLGNCVKNIGEYAFWQCSSLTSVILDDQLTTIGFSAFESCTSLSSITIPNSVTTIGKSAFQDCKGLTSVTIGSGITSLEISTFQGCSSLTTIMIPNSVTSIEDGTCQEYLSNGIRNYRYYGVFNGCSSLTSVTIGSGVTHIGSYAFPNCNNLTSFKMGENVNSIGEGVFINCSSLTSITLPSTLESIGENAFPNSMKSIELPDAFTIIPDNLFANNNFQYIKLGNNVKSIGKNAFGSWEPLLEIGTSTPPAIDKDAFPKVAYLSDINVIVPDAAAETAYRKAIVWQEMTFATQNNIAEVTVETPGDLSFELIEQCDMMPAKVVGLKVNGTINADDFNQMLVNMKSLLRLDLSDCNITEIPDNAMKGKTQLQKLTLPTKLQAIGQSAFQNCTSLQELTLQTGLQTIGQSAFQNCATLQKLTLQTGLLTIGQNAFYGCICLTDELDLPSTVTTIGESAFVGTNYTSVKMPSALKTISNYAFNNVPIKQRLKLPGRVTSVGTSAFAGTKITGLDIPDGMTNIGDYAFADTPIEGHVTIPDGITYLGKGAFRNSQLSTVFLPNSITELSQGLFQGCPNLDLVYVPDNYTGVSNSAFSGCGALTILRLSANLTSMGEYSFQSTPLEYVKIPSQVEVLPTGVLKNCRSLSSLSLPASLKTVEAEALSGCTALRNLSIEALDPPTIKDRSALRGINTDLCLISIPTQSFRKYVLAEYWGQFVQMRNDIAVETSGNGDIAFESVEEDEEEVDEESSNLRPAFARGRRRVSELASDEESMTYVSNGSTVYIPQQGQVRFYIIPAEGERVLSATLDGEDIMPYIVDGVYTATADKKNAKLVVEFSSGGQGSAGLMGDVNGDGDVSVTDVGCVINYILEQVPDPFIPAAADMNSDGSISVTDVGFIINYILNDGAAFCRAEHNATYSYGLPMLMQDTDGYVLTLDGADAFIAFQMDIFVPEDADGYNVRLKDTGTDHQMVCRRLSNGHFRVVCYSPTNETFAEGLTDLLTFASEGDMTIRDIRFTTESLDEVRFADMSATPTSIASVTDLKAADIRVYTLDGQLYRTIHARQGENPLKDLQPGIYLINNRKYIIR